jgi:hypothetical protein
MGLYSEILGRIQDVNDYGGAASTFQIRQAVLDAIDIGVSNKDQTLIGLKADLLARARAWKNVEDHDARSSFFDTYCEATFYLASSKRLPVEGIPRSSSSTPDFRTAQAPNIFFEVKTLDIADPTAGYSHQMNEGLEKNIEAQEQARQNGVGFSTQVINLHGSARTWPEVVEQTMRKLSGHIKNAQYANGPTFLVVNLGRSSVRVDEEQILPTYTVLPEDTFNGCPAPVSGQLWTIANHVLDDPYLWLDQDGHIKSTPINRAGLLRDHPLIQGIIFMDEPWSEFDRAPDWRDSYQFLGVWNEDCTLTCDEPVRASARHALAALCKHVVSTR